LQVVVAGGRDIHDSDTVSAQHPAALELGGKQLLAHALVERLLEQVLERHQVVADAAVGQGERCRVTRPPHLVLLILTGKEARTDRRVAAGRQVEKA
jgi:hypothetical protein